MIWRHLQSHFDYARFVYAQETRLLWAFVMFAAGIVALPEAWVRPVFIAGAVAGALALIFDAGRIWSKWHATRFRPRSRPYRHRDHHVQPEQAVQWKATEPRLAESSNQPGPVPVEFWWDEAVDRLLQRQSPYHANAAEPAQHRMLARVMSRDFDLPATLAKHAGAALRFDRNTSRRVRLPVRFNGRLLRLSTEPTVAQLESGNVDVTPVTYFDGEASNEVWGLVNDSGLTPGAHGDSDAAEVSPVQEYVLDTSFNIRALENAGAANIVGISIMAVTADDHFIFVQQTAGNSVAPSALAASGSGSLEHIDADPDFRPWQLLMPSLLRRGARARKLRIPLTELLLSGMLREMREESLVEESEIIDASAVVTGYFRWIDRAAKPEFAGLVRLSCTAAELQARRHTGGERAFTAGTVSVPVHEIVDSLALESRAAGQPPTHAQVMDAANEALLGERRIHNLTLGPGHAGSPGQPRVLCSPSTEQTLFAAVRFLLSEPQWMQPHPAAADGDQDC